MHKGTISRISLLIVLGAAISWSASHRDLLDVALLSQWLQQMGIWAPLLFAAIYATGTVTFVPGMVLTIIGGALFGPLWGTFYNLIGAIMGASLAFLLSRHLAYNWVRRRTGTRMESILKGVESGGWRYVAVAHLLPFLPFFLLNYAFGLTKIRLSHYILTTTLCLIPSLFAYSYVGHTGLEALSGGEAIMEKCLVALLLLALLFYLPRLIRPQQRAEYEHGSQP